MTLKKNERENGDHMQRNYYASILSNGYVTVLEVTENFWRLSRIAKRFERLSQNFEVTSAQSLNHA